MRPNIEKHSSLTHEECIRLLSYDAGSGLFHWKVRAGTKRKFGDLAGSVQKRTGYVVVSINSKVYMAHRLAWFHFHGKWPENQIDHINGVRTDNRICNLREADNMQNQRNTRLRKDNSSGFKGVSYAKQSKKWAAHIRVNGRLISLGLYEFPETAGDAYRVAADKYFGAFARTGVRHAE